jgi:Spy/CpxP family protein refolding chaperone
MKLLKSFFIAAAIVFTAQSFYAQEQTKRSPEERAKLHTERMTKQLALSPDQQAKVTELNLGIARKNEAVRNNVNMTPEQKKESIKGNMQGRNDVLKTILTVEQFEKFKQHQDMRKEKVQENHKNDRELKGSNLEEKPEEEL